MERMIWADDAAGIASMAVASNSERDETFKRIVSFRLRGFQFDTVGVKIQQRSR
jgi:hypothetical protein